MMNASEIFFFDVTSYFPYVVPVEMFELLKIQLELSRKPYLLFIISICHLITSAFRLGRFCDVGLALLCGRIGLTLLLAHR